MAWYDNILGTGSNIFGATPPSYFQKLDGVQGLLNDDEMNKLNQRSFGQGLLNTALTYFAQPKTLGAGSALPYLAKAGLSGVNAAQNVYDQATQDYITKSKISEMQVAQNTSNQLLNDPRIKGKPELEMLARKDPAKLFEYLNPKKELKEFDGNFYAVNPYNNSMQLVKEGTPNYNTLDVAKLYAYKDSLSDNDPKRAAIQKIIDELPKKGQSNINNYPAGTLPAGKEGNNKLDETLITSGNRLMQINQIQLSFKPEYQTIGGKGENAFLALKDKFSAGTLDPKQKAQLENYTKFKQGASQQLNDYIRSVTGATIGADESVRLMAATPNAGSGVFDGDSPTQFKAKLDNTIQQLKYAEARAAYIKKHGFILGAAGTPQLSDVPMIMQQREQEIISQYKLDTSKETDRKTLKTQLAAEFGLMQFAK